MRRSTILGTIVAVVLLLVLGVVLLLTSGSTTAGDTPGLGKFAVAAGTTDTRPLGEIGPGACWPGDERPSGGQAAGFASSDGPGLAADWLRKNPVAAQRLDRHLNVYADYYLILEVVPEWHQLSAVERTAQYVSKMVAVKMTTMIRVLNTYCKDNDVVVWEVQILPVDEWVFFIPGHEPGTVDPRPAFKAVCGNPLLPPPPAPGEQTTAPPSGTPPVTTTPPRTTTTPPNDDKIPGDRPAPGQYGGDGSDRHQVEGPVSPPGAGDPPAEQPTAAQPAPNPVPGGQPAPQEPTQPPATGAPPPQEAPSQCVNPPGMNICG